MKTPTDFLRAIAARVGLLKDHNRPIYREAKLYVASVGELRNEASIQTILKKTPPEDQAAMRRILGLSAIFLALSLNHSGEASTTNRQPRVTGSVSTTEHPRRNGGQAGAVITSLPRCLAPSGQFRHGASGAVPRLVIGTRVLRSMPSISGPRVRPAARGQTAGRFFVVECCKRSAGSSRKAPPSYNTQASWYGSECEGYPMADGRPFNPSALTCASWFHPLGSRLKVSSGTRSVVVTVTDRGPAMDLVRDGRWIDLSREAFRRLATLESGLVTVKLEEL